MFRTPRLRTPPTSRHAAILIGILALISPAVSITRAGELGKFDTPYYVVHTDVQRQMLQEAAARMTAMAETYHQRTKGFAGAIRSRLPFYLFSEAADYYAHGGMRGSAGCFIAGGRGQRLMAIASGQVWHIVQHEGFHQFAFNVISRNLPVWVNEGLAEYFGAGIWTGDSYVTGVIPPGRLARVQKMIRGKDLLPFLEMLTMSHREWNDQLAMRNYDQGWSMVHFLVHADNGKYAKTFSQYISDVARGRHAQSSWVKRFGKDTRAFQKKYSAWWLDQDKDPSAALRTEAVVATLTGYLARAHGLRLKFETAEEFFALARDGKIEIDGRKSFHLWLPKSLLEKALQAAGKASPGDWSNAGDLGHVLEKLIQTLAFLSNRDPEDIENLLGECR